MVSRPYAILLMHIYVFSDFCFLKLPFSRVKTKGLPRLKEALNSKFDLLIVQD